MRGADVDEIAPLAATEPAPNDPLEPRSRARAWSATSRSRCTAEHLQQTGGDCQIVGGAQRLLDRGLDRRLEEVHHGGHRHEVGDRADQGEDCFLHRRCVETPFRWSGCLSPPCVEDR